VKIIHVCGNNTSLCICEYFIHVGILMYVKNTYTRELYIYVEITHKYVNNTYMWEKYIYVQHE